MNASVIESHAENAPSLRIENAFPSLLDHARTLDWEGMDSTDHAHIPYVIILVRALDQWKKSVSLSPTKPFRPCQRWVLNMYLFDLLSARW